MYDNNFSFSCSRGYQGRRCERKYVSATGSQLNGPKMSDKLPICLLGFGHYPCQWIVQEGQGQTVQVYRFKQYRCKESNSTGVQDQTVQVYRIKQYRCTGSNSTGVQDHTVQVYRFKQNRCTGSNSTGVHEQTVQVYRIKQYRCTGSSSTGVHDQIVQMYRFKQYRRTGSNSTWDVTFEIVYSKKFSVNC